MSDKRVNRFSLRGEVSVYISCAVFFCNDVLLNLFSEKMSIPETEKMLKGDNIYVNVDNRPIFDLSKNGKINIICGIVKFFSFVAQ